eukprot:5465913-Ditylum_brightwellii.AAC.1
MDSDIICLMEVENNGFVGSVMAGVQEIMSKQMELLRTEQKKQFSVLENSAENLSKVNDSMGEPAKDLFHKIANTNSMLLECVHASREKDSNVIDVMEKVKETFDIIASSSIDHQNVTLMFANNVLDGVSSMDELHSKMTNDLVQCIEQNRVQCSYHLKEVVFDPIRSGIVSLTKAGNQMHSHSQDVIPNLMSDIDNIKNPRKD